MQRFNIKGSDLNAMMRESTDIIVKLLESPRSDFIRRRLLVDQRHGVAAAIVPTATFEIGHAFGGQ